MTPALLRARIRRLCRQPGMSQATIAASAGIERQSLGLYLTTGAASKAVRAALGIDRREDDRIVPNSPLARAFDGTLRGLPKRPGGDAT